MQMRTCELEAVIGSFLPSAIAHARSQLLLHTLTTCARLHVCTCACVPACVCVCVCVCARACVCVCLPAFSIIITGIVTTTTIIIISSSSSRAIACRRCTATASTRMAGIAATAHAGAEEAD